MRPRALALLVCGLLGCGDCDERSESAAAAAELARDAPVVPQPVKPKPAPAPPKYPRPGFTAVHLDNESPLCVFSDFEQHYNAKQIDQVERQKLRADKSVVIGTFAGWCVNEGCDDRPSMQCSVTLEGNQLIVKSRYWGDRKDGATCTNVPCRPVNAGCETPPLPAGTYTIVHGERSYELTIPSVLRSPCFGTDVHTLPVP